MLVDRVIVGLMEAPKWIRSYPLESWSVEMQRFYDERTEFQTDDFWNWFWNDLILQLFLKLQYAF